jgi:hypothetical protein
VVPAATLVMEAARNSETVVNFYQTTWCYKPEDSHFIKCYKSNKEEISKNDVHVLGKFK